MLYVLHIYVMEYYSALRKETPASHNMDELGRHCAEWNKPDKRDKYCMISFICEEDPVKEDRATHSKILA